jgi:HEAT repeat protein
MNRSTKANMKTILHSRVLPVATALFLAFALSTFAAESAAEKQQKFIAILKSDAPPQDKAIPCKQLAIYGTKDAVPALAPLLGDKDLNSWARIALEAIPGPEADEALRAAVPQLKGLLLVGTINSIGARRDAKAVQLLSGKLADGDPQVVAAASVALGYIGGTDAAKALNQALASAGKASATVIAEGCILCAENLYNAGNLAGSEALYDAVRKADVSKQRWLEATRGVILARQSGGIPLLLEQLRSPNRAEFGMALRTARELKGRDVTASIGAELDKAGSDREVMLLMVLADRADTAVLPKLLQVAQKGSKPTRVATLGLLDKFGDPSVLPVLLGAAGDADAEVAAPARSTLTRMEGKAVDAALQKDLSQASGRTLQVLIEIAAMRRMESALPVVVSSITAPDAGIRRAALNALLTLGSEKQAGDLVQVLTKTQDAADREAVESALTAICGRTGTKCLPQVQGLAKSNDAELRKVALHAYASMGGPESMSAVIAGIDDSDESVQTEAVGTLSTWPNNWPEDTTVAGPLLDLIKNGKKRSHQVQGARGYLLHIQENKNLTNPDKLKAIDNLLPLLKQAPERRLAVSALGGIPHPKTLTSLVNLTTDAAVAEEACAAIVSVATSRSMQNANKEARQKALQAVIDATKNENTKKKAADALKAVK